MSAPRVYLVTRTIWRPESDKAPVAEVSAVSRNERIATRIYNSRRDHLTNERKLPPSEEHTAEPGPDPQLKRVLRQVVFRHHDGVRERLRLELHLLIVQPQERTIYARSSTQSREHQTPYRC